MTPFYLKTLRISLFLLVCFLLHRYMYKFLNSKLEKQCGKFDIEIVAPTIVISYILSTLFYFLIKSLIL